eukprot:s83_g26.t1
MIPGVPEGSAAALCKTRQRLLQRSCERKKHFCESCNVLHITARGDFFFGGGDASAKRKHRHILEGQTAVQLLSKEDKTFGRLSKSIKETLFVESSAAAVQTSLLCALFLAAYCLFGHAFRAKLPRMVRPVDIKQYAASRLPVHRATLVCNEMQSFVKDSPRLCVEA